MVTSMNNNIQHEVLLRTGLSIQTLAGLYWHTHFIPIQTIDEEFRVITALKRIISEIEMKKLKRW